MKKYEVTLSGWYGGEFKKFWFKKNALKYANANMDWLWVDLENLWTGERTRLKETDTTKYCRTEQGEYLKLDSLKVKDTSSIGKEKNEVPTLW